MGATGLVDLPKIGTVVRSKIFFCRFRKGTSGRVRATLSEEGGPAVVIESILGDEFTVSAKEYSRFFEQCDPHDAAWAYWRALDPGGDVGRAG